MDKREKEGALVMKIRALFLCVFCSLFNQTQGYTCHV